MSESGARVLFVLTSTSTMGEGGHRTGVWLEEFTVPYYAVRDAGFAAEIVTTAGGPVPFDPRSTGEASEEIPENTRFRADSGLQAVLKASRSIEQVIFGDYAAIFLPGGHGTMWDLPSSTALARAVGEIFAAGRPVAAVCHGPAGLVGARAPDGKPLVAGRWVAAFTTEEEVAVGLKDVVPFLLDERLAALGARLVNGRNFTPTAVVDGNLITGQNPQSALDTAALLLAALRRPNGKGAPT
jgi:putative intracellular protease/amidase